MKQLKSIKDIRWIEFITMFGLLLGLELLVMFRIGYRIYPLYFLLTFSSISLIPSLVLFFKSSKTRFSIYTVFIVLQVVIFITNTCLYYYKKDIFAIAMILDIGDGITMGIKYNIFIAFPFWGWLLIFSVILAAMVFLGTIMLGTQAKKSMMPRGYHTILLFSVLVLMFSSAIIKKEDRDIYVTPQDKGTHLFTFGIQTFQQRDLLDKVVDFLAVPFKRMRADENRNQIDLVTKLAKSDQFGQLKGKNLIMIMMETGEDYAIDPVLTPTLYRLLNDGVRFTNTYGVANRNYTFDAEFKSLTSMMYYDSDNFYQTQALNHSYTQALPNILRSEGYTANSFHSNYAHYFNRDEMHRALGFERLYAREDMIFTLQPSQQFPLDSELFSQMRDEIAPIQDQPFFSFITTYYTHGPYGYVRTEVSQYYDQIEADGRFAEHDEKFINILAAHMDLDYALQLMMEDLEEKGLVEDTVILLFSDHKNYSSPEITEKYTPSNTSDLEYDFELDKVPFAIYNPTLEKREVDYVTSQYDIMPTICDLLGIELIKTFYYGQSIFLKDIHEYVHQPIIFGYTSWIDNNIFYYGNKQIWPLETEADPEYSLQMRQQINKKISQFHYYITEYFRVNETANND